MQAGASGGTAGFPSLAAVFGRKGLIVRIDKTVFIQSYERGVLSLDTLTSHQRLKLDSCIHATEKYIHLRAPAGCGKTFVALSRLLETLRSDESVCAAPY